MNFDFSDDQKLLRTTAREFLTEHAPLRLCRAVLESDASYSDTLWKGVAGIGWLGTAIPEEYGGAGFGGWSWRSSPRSSVRAGADSVRVEHLPGERSAILLAGSAAQQQQYLPKLASGESIGRFAHAEQPGEHVAVRNPTTFTDGKLTGVKLPFLTATWPTARLSPPSPARTSAWRWST